MIKILVILALMLCCQSMAHAQSGVTEITPEKTDSAAVTLQNEFWGCTLGVSTKQETMTALDRRKVVSSDYEGSIIVNSPTLEGLTYTYASMDFDSGTLSSVTFMKSGLTKDDAIVFSKAIYSTFADKYVMIKTSVDGFDCYFTNVGTTTCTIFISHTEYGYTASVCYEYGTVKLDK